MLGGPLRGRSDFGPVHAQGEAPTGIIPEGAWRASLGALRRAGQTVDSTVCVNPSSLVRHFLRKPMQMRLNHVIGGPRPLDVGGTSVHLAPEDVAPP